MEIFKDYNITYLGLLKVYQSEGILHVSSIVLKVAKVHINVQK